MAKIQGVKISNFRGFDDFETQFGITNLICIIGRGDSGKSTILDAIDKGLSPRWNLSFQDSDFHQGNIDKPIEIEVSVYDIPEELLQDDKFGMHVRFLTKDGDILDDPLDSRTNDSIHLLTVKLSVDKSLEPNWSVVSKRQNQEPKEINSRDRAKLNVVSISDYVDRHFSWTKGNPLFSLVNRTTGNGYDGSPLLDALREAKEKIDSTTFTGLDAPLKKVVDKAKQLGVDISDARTTIDFKDIALNEGKISLHSNETPFRLKGKGTKRLISLAIQSELTETGGAILIDELEQGLEPDRAQHLAQIMKANEETQYIITTHSRDVIVELSARDIFRLSPSQKALNNLGDKLQGAVRSNPEAFFCESVLVCEGVTEIGVCRALNNHRIQGGKQNAALLGVRFADGRGSEMIEYAKAFNAAGYRTCLYCDSDEENANDQKSNLKESGITIVDCEEGLSLEEQLFKDLKWDGVKKLIDYRIQESDSQAVRQSVQAKCHITLDDNWLDNDSDELRTALGKVAGKSKWFKRTDHGEFLGKVCLTSQYIPEESGFAKIFDGLSKWIVND